MRFMRLGRRLGGVGLAIGSALLLASAGCGGEGKKESAAGNEAAGAAAEAPGGTPRIALPEKKPAVATGVDTAIGQLPAGFPDDLPLPPDTETGPSISIPGQAGLVHFAAKGTPTEVLAYFTQNLPSQGWALGEKTGNDQRTVLHASKGPRKADIIIEKAQTGDGTAISIKFGA